MLHNAREELEHASMILEWIRRNDQDAAKQMKKYLFTKADILKVEEESES